MYIYTVLYSYIQLYPERYFYTDHSTVAWLYEVQSDFLGTHCVLPKFKTDGSNFAKMKGRKWFFPFLQVSNLAQDGEEDS